MNLIHNQPTRSRHSIHPAKAVLAFGIFCLATTSQAQIQRDVWTGLPNNPIDELTQSPKFTSPPDHSNMLTTDLDFGRFGNKYGQRIRGTIIPPVSGNWRFWVAADDTAELWLSPNSQATAKQKIAHLTKWVPARSFDRKPSQRSEAIPLVAGEPYYFEILHKEGVGGDHVSVAWRLDRPNFALSAAGATATQSSTGWGGKASRAIDGNTSGNWGHGSTTHTANQNNAWWEVDLGQDRPVNHIVLWNRTNNNLGSRLSNFRISVLDANDTELIGQNFYEGSGHAGQSMTWDLPQTVQARKIKVSFLGYNNDGNGYLSLAEVQVFEVPESPENQRVIVPASALSPQITDPADNEPDSLLDSWEQAFNFDSTGSTLNNEYADDDDDLIPNLIESQQNTDPFTPNRAPGEFRLERWNNINGYRIDDLVTNPAFYGPPESQQLVTPSNLEFSGKYFGTRIRGYITPETSGNYTFWISARNSAKLFLSDDTSEGKYAKRTIAMLDPQIGTGHGVRSDDGNLWDQYTSQRSEPIHLEAGQSYYLEILHQNGHGGAPHASIAWARDGGPRTSIPASMVESYVTTPDDAVDDDYLPDAWEIQYGLDPNDNGAIDPERQGERGDYDLDGLSNRLEYLYGTDPTNPDTDGDGIIDSVEINSYGTDPTVSDAPSGLLTSTLDLTSFTAADSDWTLTSQGLVPSSFRGAISWDFAVPSDGFWLLDIATTLMGDLYLHETVAIEVIINGTSMGKQTLIYGRDRHALLRVFTPYLTAGNHSLELKIHNTITRRMVSINDISVIQPQGADLNGDGIPDWIAAQIDGENALRPYSVTSRTSPANLEGSARMRSLTTLNGTPVTAGLDHSHWYADLPLNPVRATPFIVSFETNVTETGRIIWQATNVFNQESLTVRRGDTLKLIGQPTTGPSGQSVTLTFGPEGWDGTPGASGTSEVTLASDFDHHLYTLSQAGNYKVRATHADGTTSLMSIAVKRADFAATPQDLLANSLGTLSFDTSAVSATNYFDGGQALDATNPANVSGSTLTLEVAPRQDPGHTNLLARLHADGPIIGRQSVNLINFTDVLQNDSDFTYQSSDFPGYLIIRSPVVATDLPEGATVVVTIFRSGVTFLDGTKVLTLTAADFQNGIYNLEFLFPENLHGGYCHYVDIYDRHGNHLSRR